MQIAPRHPTARRLSIAFVLAIVTAAVPRDVLFKIFSGLSSGLSDAQLQPFIANMHVALWVLAATSLVGAGVSMLRPRGDREPEPVPVPAPDRAAAREPERSLEGSTA